MSQTVTAIIGGREYRLRCDNEERTRRAVAEVNRLLEALRPTTPDQSTPTLAILAALNVAERFESLQEDYRRLIEELCSQLRDMSSYLDSCTTEAVGVAAQGGS